MTRSDAGLSAAICAHVAGQTYERLPAGARHAAKRALLDAVGVMAGASGLAPEIAPFASLARAAGGGPCTLLGYRDGAPPALAALANGAAAHALDFEDVFDRAPCHPNSAAVPAALAIAQGF